MSEMEQVFAAAAQVNCSRIMMLSDVLRTDGSAAPLPTRSAAEKIESLVKNLNALAKRAEALNVTLLLEPLNTALDHRGCFLNTSAVGIEIVKRVNSPNVKLLYDIYHMSMMGEDALAEIEKGLEWIGYLHVADQPGRHQPGTGRINYRAVNTLLKRAKYEGFIGMEFSALGPDEQAAKTALEIFA
jgi:hydroxypyruvate isomerase